MSNSIQALIHQHEVSLSHIEAAIERLKLSVKVDRMWSETYAALHDAKDEDGMRKFFNEFSAANTIEQQEKVLEGWQ